MSKFSHFVAFVLGAGIGSIVASRLLKAKYELWAQNEIDSVIDTFSSKHAKLENEAESEVSDVKTDNENLQNRYNELVKEESYTNEKGGMKPMWEDKPYIISPSEFGGLDDYDTISLTYYADGVLTDDNDEPIEDIEKIVGMESLKHFGEYEDDSVFVRNDELKCDYEILLDTRNFHPTYSEE